MMMNRGGCNELVSGVNEGRRSGRRERVRAECGAVISDELHCGGKDITQSPNHRPRDMAARNQSGQSQR